MTIESPRQDDADLLSLLVAIANRARRLLLGSGIAAVVGFVGLQLMRDQYTARATFVASAGSAGALGSLGSIAASLGIMPEGGTSPKFYADLATSDAILLQVLDSARADSGGRLDYVAEVGLSHRDSLRLRDKALRHLRRHMDVGFDARTGVVSVEVRTVSGVLAVQTVQDLLAALNRFNVAGLQTAARAQRQFLEERVAQARQEFKAAQDSLQLFYTRNRQFRESPLLLLREADLRQAYTFEQQNVAALELSLEQTRISEVRDTPVLTILDAPLMPAKRSGPKRLLLALGFGMIWLGGGIGLVALQHGVRQLEKGRPAEVAALRDRLRRFAGRLGRGKA
jgi:uncharacterized protein involved in exopolysaccharide biosynthesis